MQKFLSGAMKVLPVILLVICLALSAKAQSIHVVNAASLEGDTTFAPGSIITIFGANLSSSTAFAASAQNPPMSLAGVSITVGGSAARLFFVSPGQINAVMSPSTPAGVQTLVVTSSNGTFSTTITVDRTAPPGIFSLSATGTGDGAITNA